jgi:hypothetical protein
MKLHLVVFLAFACGSLASFAVEEKPPPDAVVVKALHRPLPSAEDKKHEFLWNNFANQPDERKFSAYTTEKWQKTFEVFAAALVKKAQSQKLDSASLRKALDLILKNRKEDIAYLPVGAYHTTLDGKPVWIVTVKWEYPSFAPKGESANLGHIRIFVFDQKTLKQVGFVTCM